MTSPLVHLMTSRFAVVRAGTAAVAALLTSQAGVWYDNSLFGKMALFYSLAYGGALLAKGGGDAIFTRELGKVDHRADVVMAYLLSSALRGLFVGPFLIAAGLFLFQLNTFEIVSLLALTSVIVIGNTLRIGKSPNYQLGFDNSTFTIVVILLTVFFGVPVWISGLLLATMLAVVYLSTLLRSLARAVRPVSMMHMRSGAYLTSEMSYYILGFATPGFVSLVADLDTVGVFRSIERLVFSGTFVLFVVNNRLFHDLSRANQGALTKDQYFRNLARPPILFFLAVIAALGAGGALGIFPNIAAEPLVFSIYAVAYLITVAFGPASGALNFLGEEGYVMKSSVLGATVALTFLVLAVRLQSPMAVVLGSAAGLIVTNLLLARRLFSWFKDK